MAEAEGNAAALEQRLQQAEEEFAKWLETPEGKAKVKEQLDRRKQLKKAHKGGGASGSGAKDKVRNVFDVYDTAGTGMLDLSQFRLLLKELSMPLSKDDAAAVFAKVDADGSGTIEFDEFREWPVRGAQRPARAASPRSVSVSLPAARSAAIHACPRPPRSLAPGTRRSG